MTDKEKQEIKKAIEVEDQEWLEALDYIVDKDGPERAQSLMAKLMARVQIFGIHSLCPGNTPYINTISKEHQPEFPGNRELERRIKSINRWNAMAMVVRANRVEDGIGGHISTYASSATLYEVGFNHFFRGRDNNKPGDIIYFQGHAAPGIYARAFLEGRLSEKDLENFRRELNPDGGLSSYPHPWLMPDFWEFPTVSMGLAPIMAIYQARFNHYLNDRGLLDTSGQKIWAFLGDGEMDEPESMGAITLPAREKLDNLIFVINCNLQRLDGPVRGNGKIIQELEAAFRGAGWNVIKVIWGDDWDPLLERDKNGLLVKRMGEIVDGQSQKYAVSKGDFIREDFFGKYPELKEIVKDYSDEQLRTLRRGGHDPEKVYAAYKAAVGHEGSPTVILAQTIKGYGLGEAGEGKNITHQQKKLNEDELKSFRKRFDIPIPEDKVAQAPFYRPDENSEEMKYLKETRNKLGGSIPQRKLTVRPIEMPPEELFKEFYEGSGNLEVSTTMAFVSILSKLLKDKGIGKNVVPIVPDEARTFGMESLFRQVGIYSHYGQLYEPVDKENLLYYREDKQGAILEEGITEAGSMSSFIAAGTAYATHGINIIPFFIYYSMFGFQRIGDLIWAAGDMQAKGFLLGGTSGRTTLAGEGLQHQDGQSHLYALSVPNLLAYDPAYAYEIAVIIQDGIKRMYADQENIFYYLTLGNEPYQMPKMTDGLKDGILKGIYKLNKGEGSGKNMKVNLLGSGAILNETLKAQKLLADNYDVDSDVWSVTGYKQLYRDAIETERWNRLNPQKEPRVPYIRQVLNGNGNLCVASTDYVHVLPLTISKWLPNRIATLGTDGYGRSDGRKQLRDFFEVDHRYIALTTLLELVKEDKLDRTVIDKAMKELEINPEKLNPLVD
ncbi:MAG: pyruvate dehydrogenase (acetyl-transferring), homodimeric type [candidate division Zixibacteria bacterium]|nr:pyruvate dehydrogenase (acetyl-transferring), homodimeric type [candidate division Zixibacteria bacterium]